jgi:hypothetical protein
MSTYHPDRERVLEMAARGEAQPADLELSIARTRADLDMHLNAVESRLSSAELINQAISYVREGPGEYFSNLGRAVKSNPLPLALLALSVGWLMFEGRRAGRSFEGAEEPKLATSGVGAAARKTAARLGSGAEAMRDHVAGLASDVETAAEGAGTAARRTFERARSGAAHLGSTAHRTIEKARSGAAELGSTVREQARRVQSGYHTLLDENPMVLGLLAFAVGSAIAATLPRTRREDELMGDVRDRAAAAVQTRVEAVAEKAGSALDRALNDRAPERRSGDAAADDGNADAHVSSELGSEGAARP